MHRSPGDHTGEGKVVKLTVVIPAKVGSDYLVGLTPSGLIRLSRSVGLREVFLVFGRDEAIAIANAIVDLAEGL